jgi:hypothetical protein
VALRAAARRGSARSSRSRPSTVPATIARLAPDTATRWLRPAARKSSRTSTGRSRVSPIASPGSSPAGASGRTVAAARRPSRSVPAPVCHHGARAAARGAPRTRSTATVRSALAGRASRPDASTSWPGSSLDQPSAGAISSTRPPPRHRVPRASAVRSVAGTTTCAMPGRPASPGRSTRGSSRTTTVRVAAAPRSAAARSGCSRTADVCAVTTRPAASAQPAAATTAAGSCRRSPASSTQPAAATATTPPAGPVYRPPRTTAHVARAAGTNRRSGGRTPRPTRTGPRSCVALMSAPALAAGRAAAHRCPPPRPAAPR